MDTGSALTSSTVTTAKAAFSAIDNRILGGDKVKRFDDVDYRSSLVPHLHLRVHSIPLDELD